MSTVLKVYSGDPSAVASEAAAFLQSLSGQVPDLMEQDSDGLKRVSAADVVAFATLAATVATLILTVPGSINDAMDLRERIRAETMLEQINTLQSKLEDTDTEALLDLGDGRTVDLRRTPADKVMDVLSQ